LIEELLGESEEEAIEPGDISPSAGEVFAGT
jgi:hypothetical protein